MSDERELKGFPELPCPRCLEVGYVGIQLENLLGEEACKCDSCDETFSLKSVADITLLWQPVIEWVNKAPSYQGTESVD